jgi:hypothetical protein
MGSGFNELREKVFTVIRDSARTFVTEGDVDLWIQEAIDDLSARLYLVQNSKASTTSGNSIALPSDYLELIWLKIASDDEDYVHWVDNDTWNRYQEEEAAPNRWLGRVFNNSIEVYPTPDTGTAYTLRYWAASPSGSLTNFNSSLRLRVVNYAKSQALYKTGDFAAADRFYDRYERNLPPPNDTSKNHPPGPINLYPIPSYFDTSAYRE